MDHLETLIYDWILFQRKQKNNEKYDNSKLQSSKLTGWVHYIKSEGSYLDHDCPWYTPVSSQLAFVYLYMGKGVALERGTYWGLKLFDQVMKVLERVAENLLRQQVLIGGTRFAGMLGRSTTNVIMIVRQLQ